jgi:hypothetical protein
VAALHREVNSEDARSRLTGHRVSHSTFLLKGPTALAWKVPVALHGRSPYSARA